MSQEICPVCKKAISGTPEKCPQCSADLECYDVLDMAEEKEQNKTRMIRKTGILILGLILVNTFLLFSLIFLITAQKKTSNRISRTLTEFSESKKDNSPKTDDKTKTSSDNIFPQNPGKYSLKGYDAALELCYQGRFKKAIIGFENLLKTDYPPLYKKNILYWLGLSYYGLNEYPPAKKYFRSVLENPGFENKDADALYMLGKISYHEKQFELSKQYFYECLRDYPEKSNIEKIREYLERM